MESSESEAPDQPLLETSKDDPERPKGRVGRGCRRTAGGALLLMLIVIAGVWYYVGTNSFENLLRVKIEENLSAHLGREVSIEKLTVLKTSPGQVILDGITIANAPGGVSPYFARVRQVEIRGNIESFVERTVRLESIDIRDPEIFFEIFPEGSPLTTNAPDWKSSGPPSKFKIGTVDVKKIHLEGGMVDFLDRNHDLHGVLTNLSSEITPDMTRNQFHGTLTSAGDSFTIQDYRPIAFGLRGAFSYKDDSLDVTSLAVRGPGIDVAASGKVAPMSKGSYIFHVRSRVDAAQVRQIFIFDTALRGIVTIDGAFRGKKGTFVLDTAFDAPAVTADAYDITGLRGTTRVTGDRVTASITGGRYGGGTITGDYELTRYSEPYPMRVNLQYDRISLEKLFSDWGLKNTGLRGGASGALAYRWNKDKILAGSGDGTATIHSGAQAFGNAAYPIALSGRTDFVLNRGVITFNNAAVSTPATNVAFSGTLRIDDLYSDLKVTAQSRDLQELDRIGVNFAHSIGKPAYTLLGLGGEGTIAGTVHGPMKTSLVDATVASTGMKYNNVFLGAGDLHMLYDGRKNVLTFDRARFSDNGGELSLTGTLLFPDLGPSPEFDLLVQANRWPVDRTLKAIALDLKIEGLGTGRLKVTGTSDTGKVVFQDLKVADGGSLLHLGGTVGWQPGVGNVTFDLDVGATNFPVGQLIAFLAMGDVPVTGAMTGTIHLEGPKAALQGAGSFTVTKGTIYGEPVDLASADILFTTGVMRARNIVVRSPAGLVSGEAEYDFSKDNFSYLIKATALDLSKVKLLSNFSGMVAGKLDVTSSGAGSITSPEMVLEGTLKEGSLNGVPIPATGAPPTIYMAVRNNQLIMRGSAFDFLTLQGEGNLAADGQLSGLVQTRLTDIGKLTAMLGMPDMGVTGPIEIDLKLGGKVSSFSTIDITGTIPQLALQIGGQQITSAGPILFGLHGGRAEVDSFKLQREGSSFTLAGGIDFTGDKKMNFTLNGTMQAALLQLAVPNLKASGQMKVSGGITGTLKSPILNGTAEIIGAQFKVPGLPQLIDNVTGSVIFRGSRIDIDSLKATLGGGTVTVGGFVTLNGLNPDQVRLNIQGQDVSLRYFEGVAVTGNFSLVASGDTTRVVLQGDVRVGRALYFKDFDITHSILNMILEKKGLAPAVAASWQDKVSLRIHLAAPGTLAVKNNVADVTGSADLDLTGTLANPVFVGRIDIDEGGKVRFQDVDYQVVRGTVNFQNPFRTDPFFDITAEGRVQDYDLTVNITGTPDRIVPTVTSDPPISDLTLLSLLGPSSIGAEQRVTTFGSSTGLQATGTSLLYQSLGGLIGAKILPFADSVRLDLEGASANEPTVTFEKRISNVLNVIVIYDTTSNQNREVIEWQITPEYIVQFTRDSEQPNTYLINAVDARFRRQFGAHWK